jgi:hypothetical protein
MLTALGQTAQVKAPVTTDTTVTLGESLQQNAVKPLTRFEIMTERRNQKLKAL